MKIDFLKIDLRINSIINKMVFKIDKYRNILEGLIQSENPQKEIDEWIRRSPKTGKELAFTTVISRKSALKNYLRREFNFKYDIPAEQMLKYKELKTEIFESKPTPVVDMTIIDKFINRFENKWEYNGFKFTQGDVYLYKEETRRNPLRIALLNDISTVMFYLMLQSGLRINEFHNKVDKEGNVTLSKKGNNKVIVKVKPLSGELEEWLDCYHTILPFIENDSVETLTTRMNRFIKTIEPSFTSHMLRKVYAELCSKNDNRKIPKIVKIKQCLNHDNISSSEHYKIDTIRTKRCEVCDIDVLKKNFSRHLKTKKHLNQL